MKNRLNTIILGEAYKPRIPAVSVPTVINTSLNKFFKVAILVIWLFSVRDCKIEFIINFISDF